MTVPLIEDSSGGVSSTTETETTDGPSGPSITVNLSDGATRTIGSEEMILYLRVLQTTLLIVLLWMEVRSE